MKRLHELLRLVRLQWPLWAMVFAPAITFTAVAIAIGAWLSMPVKPGCTVSTSSLNALSEDPRLAALVEDESCIGAGETTPMRETQNVYIVDEEEKRRPENEVLAIEDYQGALQLKALWISPQRLQITIPNLSSIVVFKQRYDGIDIEL